MIIYVEIEQEMDMYYARIYIDYVESFDYPAGIMKDELYLVRDMVKSKYPEAQFKGEI